jgi:hypothetical protein
MQQTRQLLNSRLEKADNAPVKNRDVIGAACLLLGVIATFSSLAQSTRAPDLASPPQYRVVHGWPVLPEGEVLGSVAGIGVDSRGEVFVFHRAGRTWPKSDVLDLTPIPRPTVDIFDRSTSSLPTGDCC